MALQVPEEKIRKLVYLLFEPQWDWGSRRLERELAQSTRGNVGYVENVCPGLRPEAASLDAAMGGRQDTAWIEREGSEEEKLEVR